MSAYDDSNIFAKIVRGEAPCNKVYEDDAMNADGLTIQQFNETAGGQVIFHIHFHVLPRWEGVALRPHSGQMVEESVLRANAEKIRAALGFSG